LEQFAINFAEQQFVVGNVQGATKHVFGHGHGQRRTPSGAAWRFYDRGTFMFRLTN